MQASNLPFRHWFIALYLMTSDKKTISAYHVQREIGHKYYEPIWAMMHKIRKSMGQRDEKYLLSGQVEVDEGFFETLVPKEEKEDPRKRGRGSQKQTMAMVFAESEEVEDPKIGRPNRRCRYFKMVVCPNFDAEQAKQVIEKSTRKGVSLVSDGHSVYKKLKAEGMNLSWEVTPKEEAHIKLPWVHSSIGNLKRILKGVFHHSDQQYLQSYLDEFCFKLNRRYFGKRLFKRGLVAMTLT